LELFVKTLEKRFKNRCPKNFLLPQAEFHSDFCALPGAETSQINSTLRAASIGELSAKIAPWNFLSESKQFGYVLDNKKRHKMNKCVGLKF
tara:strand:- start:647 stop:919 length:273 start_codon:yes stop_codon:yes gene_type:complete